MFEIGRVCVKIAGRDAHRVGVIVDTLDARQVLIDGQVRRKKCNMSHLEPLQQIVPLNKNASHEEVVAALKTINVVCPEKKPQREPKQTSSQAASSEAPSSPPTPKKQRKESDKKSAKEK